MSRHDKQSCAGQFRRLECIQRSLDTIKLMNDSSGSVRVGSPRFNTHKSVLEMCAAIQKVLNDYETRSQDLPFLLSQEYEQSIHGMREMLSPQSPAVPQCKQD